MYYRANKDFGTLEISNSTDKNLKIQFSYLYNI